MAVINGLASLHPILPRIPIHPTDHNLTQYVTSKPWNAIGRLPVGVIFSVVGLAFFMPLDMSFSCVFFFFLGKIQRFVLGALGTRQVAGTEYMVFLSQQAFGALMGIALVAIWVNRRHFIGLFRGSYTSNVDESLSYGKAGLGIVLGIGFMTLFLWKAGMAIWLSLVFFLLYYLISLGITRFRAEMGLPFHDFARGSNFTGPDQMLGDIFGVRRLGYRNVTVMSMLFFFNFTYRGHPQPHQMEGFALLNRAGVSNKRVFLAMGGRSDCRHTQSILDLFTRCLLFRRKPRCTTLCQHYLRTIDQLDKLPIERYRLCRHPGNRCWFARCGFPDGDASAISVVAAASSGVCNCKWC